MSLMTEGTSGQTPNGDGGNNNSREFGAGNIPGNGNPGSGDSGQPGTDSNQAASTNPGGNAPQDWRHSLDPQLREEAVFKTIPDVATLAKNYLNAQKLVGADKINVPTKHATPEDWKAVYTKLGLPIDMKDYTLKEPESIKGEFVGKFKEAAFKAGVLPKQVQEIVDWFAKADAEARANMGVQQDTTVKGQIEALKQEWGVAFSDKVAQAKSVLQKYGDPELMDHLDKSGLGNDTKLIKLMSKIGESLKESGIAGHDSGMSGSKSPGEAHKAIKAIQGNSDHPYHNKSHPSHQDAVKEMQGLFSQAYPSA